METTNKTSNWIIDTTKDWFKNSKWLIILILLTISIQVSDLLYYHYNNKPFAGNFTANIIKAEYDYISELHDITMKAQKELYYDLASEYIHNLKILCYDHKDYTMCKESYINKRKSLFDDYQKNIMNVLKQDISIEDQLSNTFDLIIDKTKKKGMD